jgi:SAM-dependent methyltransferase
VTESVSFDRAAEYYDRTRALPRDAHEQVIGHAVGEVAGRGRVLEVGVGTGRIGLDLAAAGVPLTGLDLSRAMLDRLVAKAGGTATLPVVHGDATTLPFPDGTFGAAVACHVLHLVPTWEAVLDELARVVGPGGALLVSRGTPSTIAEVLNEVGWRSLGRWVLPGPADAAPVDEAARRRGFTVRTLGPVVARGRRAPNVLIDGLLQRQWGWSWSLTDDEVEGMAEAMRQEAVARWGSVDELVDDEQVVDWHVYDVPS